MRADFLPGLWDESDLSGGQSDAEDDARLQRVEHLEDLLGQSLLPWQRSLVADALEAQEKGYTIRLLVPRRHGRRTVEKFLREIFTSEVDTSESSV